MRKEPDESENHIINVDFLKSSLYDFAFIRGRFTSERKNRIAEKIIKKRDNLHDLVLDLTQVEDADSSCSAALMMLFQNVKREGGELYLCGVRGKTKKYFEMSKISKFVEVYDTFYDFIGERRSYTL